MGLELELSELAMIRPIRTSATNSVDSATPTLPGSDGEDAADTGCVTPTAAVITIASQSDGVDVEAAGCVTPTTGRSSVLLQGDDVDDNTGCVTPTTATIPAPTTPRRGVVAAVVVDAVFVTPTSAASVLRPSMECPPAPRKPVRSPVVVAKRKSCGGAPQRCFFPVPRDLTKVFVARGPADSSPPQAAKKIRVHPVV